MIPMPSDAEIARLMRLPPWLTVNSRLRAKIRGLIGTRAEWLADGGRALDFLIGSGRLTPTKDADGDDLLEYLKTKSDVGPGRLLNILGRARELLERLNRSVTPTIALKTYRSNLIRAKADGRVPRAAISHDPKATAITIQDLFPAMPTKLGDAVDYLALVFLKSLGGRPQEGVQVPTRLIKRDADGYFIDEAWSKTDPRTVPLEPRVIEAINLVAKLDPAGGRHRVGVDADHLLERCDYPIVPRVGTHRDRILPGSFTEFWFGRRLRRRVRDLCLELGIAPKYIDVICARVSGKAARKGLNAETANGGASPTEQSAAANLKTRNLLVTYADGMRTDGMAVEEWVLGFLPAAMKELVAC